MANQSPKIHQPPKTHQPKLRQLGYLCTLADKKHFGNAAKDCHVSQSTLSTGINELETTLGVTLVERSSKGVLLTGIGEEVVKRSRTILAQVEDLMAACELSTGPFHSRLRLGVIPTIAPFLLPQLLKKLRQKYPDFQLYIREDLSAHIIESLQQGQIDLILLALPYPMENLEIMPLFKDNFLLAYPKAHPVGKKQTLKSKDLKNQELLLLEDGHCLRDHALQACKLHSQDVSMPYQATSLNTVVQMVANGIGITLLPEMALKAHILRGTNVETRSFDEEGINRGIGLAWRKHSPREQEFKMLGQLIQEEISTKE